MEVSLQGIKINVLINRKNNKNIYFRFDDDLNLVVSTPRRIKEKEIEELIKKNEKSLLRLYNKSYKRNLKDTEFWYLGNPYEIIYDEDVKDIIFDSGTIRVDNYQRLEKFVKKMTKEIFEDEVLKLREIIKTPDFKLKLRKMKTRWGVCNYKQMTITLNTELIKYNKDLLRYVIVHEMCHFYHHDHSKNFWEMVSIYYPDYKKARKELRD